MSGHTYLNITPTAKLLASPDPYDFSDKAADPYNNNADFLWDASLYDGKYYLYFGPVPALLFWVPVRFFTGIALTDPQLVLGFSIMGTTFLAWLLAAIAAREKIGTRLGLAFVILTLSFGTWLPFMLRRPSFYEVAISGAYCFSALGLLLLWQGFRPGNPRARLWLGLASLCFGLAAGCRITHVFALAILLIAVMTLWRRQGKQGRSGILLCLLGPWLLCMGGLMAYNHARFGNAFESGTGYILTIVNAHSPTFKSLRWVSFGPNLYFYLLKPLVWKSDHTFPFFLVAYHDITALPFINVILENNEPVYGLFVNSPLSLMLFTAPYFWIWRRSFAPETCAIVTGIAVYGALLLGVLLFYFYTTARYEVDFSPWLMFFAGVQYLRLLGMAKPRTDNYYGMHALGGAAAAYGVFTGIMSGYCGPYLCGGPNG